MQSNLIISRPCTKINIKFKYMFRAPKKHIKIFHIQVAKYSATLIHNNFTKIVQINRMAVVCALILYKRPKEVRTQDSISKFRYLSYNGKEYEV